MAGLAMAMPVEISEVTSADLAEWVELALQLWPPEKGASESQAAASQAWMEMEAELAGILRSSRDTGLLVRDGDGRAIAFMNLSLCNEYVPGATQFPVAYIEGIYVVDEARHTGVGAALMARGEAWARARGCKELASDVVIDNEASQKFHTRVGFEEVERVVFFIKDVETP